MNSSADKGIDKIDKKLVLAGLGRFHVMAILQAARYYLVYGDMDKAMSYGLNRAVFYAWAKYYGPHTRYWRTTRLDQVLRKKTMYRKCPEGMEYVLGECVGVDGETGYYVMGGKIQSPRDYREQVVRKVEKVIDYDIVWEKTLEYLTRFPRQVLEDPQKFYKLVYEPVRDTFFKEIIVYGEVRVSKWVMDRIERMKSIEGKQKKLF